MSCSCSSLTREGSRMKYVRKRKTHIISYINEFMSLVAQLVKNLPAMQETLVQFLGWKDIWRRDRLPTPVFLGFLMAFFKESPCSAEDLGSIPGLARTRGGGLGNPLHGNSTRGYKESDMTEQASTQHILWPVAEISSFLVLKTIPLCRDTTMCLFTHLLIDF